MLHFTTVRCPADTLGEPILCGCIPILCLHSAELQSTNHDDGHDRGYHLQGTVRAAPPHTSREGPGRKHSVPHRSGRRATRMDSVHWELRLARARLDIGHEACGGAAMAVQVLLLVPL